MLPASYTIPVAAIFLVGGLLACFAGYRLFRVVLGIYGFMLGAAVTTSLMGASSTVTLVVAALVGGLVGSVLFVAAYFIGVGLVGGLLSAVALNAGWHAIRHADPPVVVLVIVAVLGALAALSVVRYVVVFATAVAGSWTAILGGLMITGDAAARRAASAGDIWVIYPYGPTPLRWWVPVAWIALARVGVVAQLSTPTKLAGGKKAKKA